ncbi:MAG: phenylalanine--tRNA ligase subunit beta [Proteobacteria bacterium]|nr:phenylalanine--tRNA ligase subunit beta [Pseudomonadota bacterium]MBU1640999.1 phenylalanine--tRNA ligase subunit beta [Pseudomonadota bacterium]
MKFTVDWLKQYTDFTYTPQELADRLTMAGLEVDAVCEIFAELKDVKVAEILAAHPHPEADRLQVCDVQVGKDAFRIVCGAPNARPGIFVPVALPGVVLPGDFKIKKSKIRGQASDGMLCSAKELGLSKDAEGIMELAGVSTSGQSILEALGLNETLIEVDLTPNRPDCASVIGTAREVAAMSGNPLHLPVTKDTLPILKGSKTFKVSVDDQSLCPRYVARRMTGVTVAPSPWWLQKRLISVGQRPINNVVDATNFVMLEFGQPLHAFDFKKLAKAEIIVRPARKGEKITTLDGQERELDPAMLMICDAEKPVAVAGVMGGGNSEVDDTTTEILLESACFNAVSVRKTARSLNLSTDASYRFERGVDPHLAPVAMERLVQILTDIAGATVEMGGIDLAAGVPSPVEYTLRVSQTNRLLGTDFNAEKISSYLSAIEMTVRQIDADTLGVTPPSFRIDIEREADLIEEVTRLHGYNEIGTTLPVVPMSFAERDAGRSLKKEVADILMANSCYEAINYSFVSPEHADHLGLAGDDERREVVTILNPLTEDQSVMRRSLLPALLENVRRNINHQNGDVRLFEMGKVFIPKGAGKQPHEERRLAVVLSGRRYGQAPALYFEQNATDFADIKGVAFSLLKELRLNQIAFAPDDHHAPYVDSSQALLLTANGETIGQIGRFSKQCLSNFAIKQDVYFIDIDFDALTALKPAPKRFEPLPKYPSVQRDIAILVPVSVAAGEMVATIWDLKDKLVENVELFDVYRGKNIDEGFKSVAISVTYRSQEKTLQEKAVAKVHQRIVDMVMSRFGGRLREV